MIEKLSEYKITSRDGSFINVECNTKIINTLVQKLNELVDTVNELQNRSSNTLIKTLRMDKEFAEDECVRLQGKLETTQNVLEVALAALNTIKPKKDVSQGGFWTLSQSDILDVILRAEKEIKRITKGGDNE